jgi:probable rRNA maturation factor
MAILIQYHSYPQGLDCRALGALTRKVAQGALKVGNGPSGAEVSVVYTRDEEMQELNEKYRRMAHPTDVLAFALTEGDGPLPRGGMLGDVVISLDMAGRQAQKLGHSLRHEIAILLIHGVLHLLGYDHERVTIRKAMAMRAAERACLDQLQSKLVV